MDKTGKVRIAIIDRELCTKDRCGYQCHKVCPGVRMGDETVVIDTEGNPIISEILCSGCGICPKKCPMNCITIINLMSETGAPIYQYGENSFRLYGLPLPQKGVTGLIGKNGIGKSTAIRLLAGQITPNFANFDIHFSNQQMMERLAPELQNYFRSIRDKQVKVSLKPQDVYKIPEVFRGTARELLQKSDERHVMAKATEEFSLGEILDKRVSVLSGGELQRLAIAVAYCKEADLYYFDEPAAYLDIGQRMAMARAIKGLSEEKNVIVIEHDLAIFDYLSEYVHVFFGTENAYGVVSGVKAARSGINEYLDGYLHDENMRFRDHGIKFSIMSAVQARAKGVKFTYPALEKKFDRFTFTSKEGQVHEGEVIGILGQNALGKSVFIKMIAGLEKPDNCESLSGMKISYKPQYVKAEENTEVRELFMRSGTDLLFLEQAKRKLLISPLMEKKLTELSGGELQRVACAYALCQDADLYLFDEPSAFLDIEQRLEFADLLQSRIANSRKCAFVIDHDLVILDAVSSRMMMFEGMPGREGHANMPSEKREGMNAFLKTAGITLRRDKDSMRPRINKPGSALDREQKAAGEHYYYEG
ncbi:MAG: ribosome biogenesis/translation initiation ATPase RLI [Candidatus Micrarchaeota archaeon]|nr:ribosome biogenesis/translation initiation ATPase RLI [Candidatus Micrarchaeota archaeon]